VPSHELLIWLKFTVVLQGDANYTCVFTCRLFKKTHRCWTGVSAAHACVWNRSYSVCLASDASSSRSNRLHFALRRRQSRGCCRQQGPRWPTLGGDCSRFDVGVECVRAILRSLDFVQLVIAVHLKYWKESVLLTRSRLLEGWGVESQMTEFQWGSSGEAPLGGLGTRS